MEGGRAWRQEYVCVYVLALWKIMCGQKSPDSIISTYIMHVCLGYAPYMYGVHVYTVPTCGLFLALCIVS